MASEHLNSKHICRILRIHDEWDVFQGVEIVAAVTVRMGTVTTTSAPRLILICGLPGSGKSTLARRLEEEVPALRLCGDEWMTQLDLDLYDEEAEIELSGSSGDLPSDCCHSDRA